MAVVFDVPVRSILLPDPVKEGLDLLRIANNARKLHAGIELKPIVVQRVGILDIYRITNGRHRFLAYVLAGWRMVTVTEEES
jgi:hypothetical protein